MTSQLDLYNGALMHVGERKLASLTENREPRRLLDDVWSRGAVRTMLEEGQWTFGTRTFKIEYDAGVTPDFGYRYAFPQPTDYVRTVAVCTDEYFSHPLTQYEDEAGYWWSDYQELYIRMVSDHEDYGGNLGEWPPSMARWAEVWLAIQICERLTQNASKMQALEKVEEKLRKKAEGFDAMRQPARFKPPGSWTQARWGGRSGRNDRGYRNEF